MFYYYSMGVLPAYVYTMCLPKKARRGHQIPCNWSYRWLSETTEVPGILVLWERSQSVLLRAKPLLYQRLLSNIPGPWGAAC